MLLGPMLPHTCVRDVDGFALGKEVGADGLPAKGHDKKD